jgi:voltage-gated potassium channel
MYRAAKRRVYILLHPELDETKWEKVINGGIILLIILNVFAVMLETVPSIYEPNKRFFDNFDLFSVFIFTVEYILRVWSSTEDKKYKHPVFGRLRYMLSWGALIDLFAIVPSYLHAIMGFDLRFLRILRLMRFFRLFRLTAYMKATKLVIDVFRLRINELLLSLVLIVFLFIISSSVMYFVEHNDNPDFSSIPATMWWSIVSLTTVGYGDMTPVTPLGKTLTGVMLLIGVALLALPAGIITSGFLEELRNSRRPKQQTCPHCGKPLDLYEKHHVDH